MSKHTPGPWIFELGEAYRVRSQQDGGQIAIMGNLKGQFGLGGRRNSDEVACNARLIAAAPDLLEALGIVIEADDFLPRLSREQRDLIDSAIAKATGGKS
jgi:hypothetical protein